MLDCPDASDHNDVYMFVCWCLCSVVNYLTKATVKISNNNNDDDDTYA